MTGPRQDEAEPASVITKAGPYIGPKGGLWADPQHTVHWESVKHEWKPRFGTSSPQPQYERIDKQKADGLFLFYGDAGVTRLTANVRVNMPMDADTAERSAASKSHAQAVMARYDAAKAAGFTPKRVQVGGNTALAFVKNEHVLTAVGADALVAPHDATTPLPSPPFAVRLSNGVAVAAKVGPSGLEAHAFAERDHAKQMVDSLAEDGHRTRVYKHGPDNVFHVAIADESKASFDAPVAPLTVVEKVRADAQWKQDRDEKIATKKLLDQHAEAVANDIPILQRVLAEKLAARGVTVDPGPYSPPPGYAEERAADLEKKAMRTRSGQWAPPAYGEKFSQLPDAEKYSNKHIASLIRDDVKTAVAAGAIPRVKVSVKMRHPAIDMVVSNVPFQVLNPDRVKWDAETPYTRPPYGSPEFEQFTPAGKQLIERLTAIHGAYNFDRSDISSDYFDVNYYGRPEYERDMLDNERRDILAGKLKPEGVVLPGPDKGVAPEPVSAPEPISAPTHAEEAPATGSPQPHLMTLAEYRQAVMAGTVGDAEGRRLAESLNATAINTPDNLRIVQRDFDKHTATQHLLEQMNHGVEIDAAAYDIEAQRIRSEEHAHFVAPRVANAQRMTAVDRD